MSKPYGANDQMEEWAKERGLTYSERGRCLHWVSKGRCGVGLCNDGHSSRDWMDHVSGWTRSGERFLICQPYAIRDFESLDRACKDFDLDACVTGDGWYGHGTVCIVLRPMTTK